MLTSSDWFRGKLFLKERELQATMQVAERRLQQVEKADQIGRLGEKKLETKMFDPISYNFYGF